MIENSKVNILLVDDQPSKLLSYEVILGELQENLLKAGSAQEALQLLLRNEIAVVLVDVCMPEMDGFELADMIRRHPRCDKTSIILVSAVHMSDIDRLRGYGCGAVDYVPVPVVPELLRAKVSVFADLYRKTEQLSRLNAELERRVAERTAELEATSESERNARAAAEAANRLKDDFLATLSHELRTPINAVLGWVHLMKRGDLDPESMEEGLGVIDRGIRMQVRLIDELLDVNRITSGKFRINDEIVELPTLLDAAIDTIKADAKERGQSIRRKGEVQGLRLRGDGMRLQQVIWNLLTNASKFTPEDGLIEVNLERRDSKAVITISDNGQGIRPEVLPHIFERFRQADSSLTRRHSGLGLGLTIAKHIVEMHGGTIHAESEGEGRGAKFIVSVPIATVACEASSGGPDPVDIFSTDLTGLSVLVVDDDAATREIVARTLNEYSAHSKTAASADEALRQLAERTYDILVCDIGMPIKDGYALIREVRAQNNSVPAIALTAYTRIEDRAKSLAAGYNVHMSKPINPNELILVVSELTGRHRPQTHTRAPIGARMDLASNLAPATAPTPLI